MKKTEQDNMWTCHHDVYQGPPTLQTQSLGFETKIAASKQNPTVQEPKLTLQYESSAAIATPDASRLSPRVQNQTRFKPKLPSETGNGGSPELQQR
eukprot:364137-Chlamydomonas_euryale.AAC.11